MSTIAGFVRRPVFSGLEDVMGGIVEKQMGEDWRFFHSRKKGDSGLMTYMDQGREFHTVFTGTLFNARELRRELGTDEMKDAALVTMSYARWGADCLHKFNGVFAFAIREGDRVFLARDRMGVRPLFYTEKEGGLLFASRIGTLLAFPGIRAVLDRLGLMQIIMLGPGRLPGSGVFRDIREIEPGCYGMFEKGHLELTRYWQLRDRPHTDSFQETSEKVRWLVTDAILRQIPEGEPMGTFLSGGLDSGIISAVCAREHSPLQTFSVDYLNNDLYFTPGKFQPNADGDYIRLMVEHLHSDHHWSVLTAEDLSENLDNALEARELPGMADIDASLLVFSREIRPHAGTALSGECADEIFGGYPWYRDPEIRDREGFPWAQNTAQRAGLMKDHREEAEAFVREAYDRTCRESHILDSASDTDRRIRQLVNLNFRWFMQTLIDRNDRMSSPAELSIRTPFCDWRVAEYLYSVPWEMKNYQGREKGLLRHAFRDLLPREVLLRKKSPYPKTFDPAYERAVSAKIGRMLKSDSPLWELIEQSALIDMLSTDIIWPWYGQLMRKPQMMGYFLQLDHWLRRYSVTISL